MESKPKIAAKRWMEAVYTGDTSIVDELASDNIAISYPVFVQIFNTPTLRGKDAVRRFIERFATRWSGGKLTYEEVIEEGNRVALMWTFEARNIGSLGDDKPATNETHRWGGITIIQFDQDGKISVEIGEESDPGPAARLGS